MNEPRLVVRETHENGKVTVTAVNPSEQPKADVLAALMQAAWDAYIEQNAVAPSMIYCGVDFYRDMMRRSKHIHRMRNWAMCTSRKVVNWKGRKFSYVVTDQWMAEGGKL